MFPTWVHDYYYYLPYLDDCSGIGAMTSSLTLLDGWVVNVTQPALWEQESRWLNRDNNNFFFVSLILLSQTKGKVTTTMERFGGITLWSGLCPISFIHSFIEQVFLSADAPRLESDVDFRAWDRLGTHLIGRHFFLYFTIVVGEGHDLELRIRWMINPGSRLLLLLFSGHNIPGWPILWPIKFIRI